MNAAECRGVDLGSDPRLDGLCLGDLACPVPEAPQSACAIDLESSGRAGCLDLAGIALDRVDTTRSLLRRSDREHSRHFLTPEGRILDADTVPASR